MSHGKMTYEDLLQIIELVKESEQWSEFHLKVGDLEVDFKRAPRGTSSAPSSASDAVPTTPLQPATSSQAPHPGHRAAPLDHSPDAVLVKAPMVGTFYRAPEPGAPPFVDTGHSVSTDTIVCIIEVMKLMNSIPAGGSGVVTQILVGDGEPVEYGQVLMVIEPR